ncbi:MAG: dihydroorotase [Capnocytophaga sp.]|nr:dihydroorotase [Capnocytophaga sp.]
MKILLKAATILDSESPFHRQKRTILIENGIIRSISEAKVVKDTDAVLENVFVSQGWTDSSVSFGEPGYEERESLSGGMKTASKSGFTHVMVNPLTFPVADTKSAISYIKERTKGFACTAHPIGALTQGSKGEALAELYDMQSGGAVAFGDYKKPVDNANLLKIALQYTQPIGAVVISFAHDVRIAGKGVAHEHIVSTRLGLKGIPTLAEELIVARDLAVLEYAGGRLHIPTVSTKRSIEMIRDAKAKGLDVTCSVALHNIHFTDAVLEGFDTRYKVLPPLRDTEHVKALRNALIDGTVDFVTSDHNPLDIELKLKEFDHAAYGTIGLENVFGILSQYVSTERTVELLTAARKRFGITSRPIDEQKEADLTIFTPEGDYLFGKEHIMSSSKNAIFLGEKHKGKVLGCIANKLTTI